MIRRQARVRGDRGSPQRAGRTGRPGGGPAPRVLVCEGYDQAVRWEPGTRLEHLFEDRCDQLRACGHGDRLAVDAGDERLTYDELDARANQLARHLAGAGAGPGMRVGLLFDRPVQSLVAMLAVLKVNAAYVPLDVAFPPDRLTYVVDDARVAMVLTLGHLRERFERAGAQVVCLDEDAELIGGQDRHRLTDGEKGVAADELCYVVYTSGSTGRPKGVAIEHASICNFVRVAAEVYGIEGSDRVYQGMTIAFDFSVEEIWVPLVAGATLVPKPPEAAASTLVGHDLARFLEANGVTGLCCVPTLLATLEEDVPGLRFLLVSGEACPHDLIVRWHRPGRRFLNVYGPTEATVSATCAVVGPDRPVTVGVPLPTYSVVILDPDADRALPAGAVGEIGIAGIGLARGYLNRDDLTQAAFVPDFLGIANNPSGRIYRTGDLGLIDGGGEIEYHGRKDSQVKLRGYRVELAEIESVLLRAPGVAQAVVATHEPVPGVVELVGYCTRRADVAELDREAAYGLLRQRLPPYMVPAYLEELATIPMLPSDKADRKCLPPPRGPRYAAEQNGYVGPSSSSEHLLTEALATALRLERPSVESHFFEDLGADSLTMARFCALVRRLDGLPPVSMQDVYLHPTVKQLAGALDADVGGDAALAGNKAAEAEGAAGVSGVRDGRGLAEAEPGAGASGARGESGPAGAERTAILDGEGIVPAELVAPSTGGTPARGTSWTSRARPAGAVPYAACGAAQFLLFVVWISVQALVLGEGVAWIDGAAHFVDVWQRSVAFVGGTFVAFSTLPILCKWLLIGRFEAGEIQVWSRAYLRFWLVKLLVRTNPMVLFAGSPLYVLYLRALGARIGRRVLILSRTVPVCTDLLTIGDGAVILKDASIACYRARAGRIEMGPVTLGAGVLVGEQAVLDIGTSMGDGAQLAHASALLAGQSVLAGQSFAGSPGRPGDAPRPGVEPVHWRPARSVVFTLMQLAGVLFVSGPLTITLLVLAAKRIPMVGHVADPGASTLATGSFYRDAAVVSLGLLVAGMLAGLTLAVAAARLLRPLLRPGRVYPLYGASYRGLRLVARATNIRFFTFLFGDSSAIVYYLQALGYRLAPVEQTGSNFGMVVRHDVPHLCTVGSGTMVSDGLSFSNGEFSSTSFRLSRVTIGPRNFLGNLIAAVPGTRAGDDCLLATKVMLPTDGPVRERTGLLGSPPFPIPRSVPRGHSMNAPEAPKGGEDLRSRLRAKNRHNAVTIGLFLLIRWASLFALTVFVALATVLYARFGPLGEATVTALALPATVAFWVLVDRAATAHADMRSRLCSIYDVAFWRHERFWKVPAMTYVQVFNGTAFKGLIWRLLGVRIGRRCFDDGAWFTERALVTIGDDCTLNAGIIVQGHSLEDGTFKSDRVVVGSRCTLGTNAFVHYGTTIGDGVVLEADSFLMKGEEPAPATLWQGNPARPVGSASVATIAGSTVTATSR